MRPLVWFRADLRTRDNTALAAACRAADDGVVGVFAVCPRQWLAHDQAAIKVDFVLRNLAALSRALAALEIPLLITRVPDFRGVPRALLDLAERHGCDGLWLNDEYEVNERRRDENVRELFTQSGRAVHGHTDQVVLPPTGPRTGQGGHYTVFTPYKKRWIATAKERGRVRCAPRPPAQRPTGIRPDPVPERLQDFPGHTRPDLWREGEEHALERLRGFISERVERYAEQRDHPAANGTSALSPYLAAGVLSPRQCLAAALAANRDRYDAGSAGVVTWISELIWREFYRHVLTGFPRVSMHDPFDLRTRRIPWRDDPEGLARWASGTTGVPIVDAGMRQLAQTGWMHNRVRMIVAMFLTKNLFIDWRAGERHFMRHLVDGDLASNNGGWQWSASVGTDAAPYFRVFNPVSQSEKFDRDGEYIRRFVPELADVPAPAIHMPVERAPELFAQLDYPEPLVDLKASRRRAIETFKASR